MMHGELLQTPLHTLTESCASCEFVKNDGEAESSTQLEARVKTLVRAILPGKFDMLRRKIIKLSSFTEFGLGGILKLQIRVYLNRVRQLLA